MPADPNPPEPAAPQIVVPPEVADAVRAAGYASLVTEDGHPLMRVLPEPEKELYARVRESLPDEELRAIVAEFEASDGTTYTLEEILADLPGRRFAEAA